MPPRPRLAPLALPLALTFACTTVRAPASAIDPTVPVRGGVAEPQLELWVESSREVGADDLARASDDARRALREAVAERQGPGGDQVLVVRAQAVSRTASRRSDQKAAVAGLVVGAVVVAAIAVLAVASGKGGGGGPRAASVRGGSAGRGAAAPIVAPRGGPAVRPHAVRVASPRPAGGAVAVWAVAPVGPVEPLPDSVAAPEPLPPEPLAPGATPSLTPHPGPLPAERGEGGTALPTPTPTAPEVGEGGNGPSTSTPDVLTVTLPPPAPLEIEDRGFFAKDLLRLELLVVDPRDGTIHASKTVTTEVDVRDAAAVREALASALDDAAGWQPAH